MDPTSASLNECDRRDAERRLKPRLTDAAASDLAALAGYADAEASVLYDSPRKDQREHACEVLRGCEWIRRFLDANGY